MRRLSMKMILLCWALMAGNAHANDTLNFAVGLYQPNKELNDKTYQPLAIYLAKKLKRSVKLKTVDTWEGIAKSLANGETDIALMGPWGYVISNNEADAQVVATIEYQGKPEYFAIMITHPKSGITSIKDLKGKSFAFGDKGSTSGYLIPFYHFMKNDIDPDNAQIAAFQNVCSNRCRADPRLSSFSCIVSQPIWQTATVYTLKNS